MTRPMTTTEYFQKICEILQTKNLWFSDLDYALPSRFPAPIKIVEFTEINQLEYGGSEGIYLSIGIHMKTGENYPLGIFKTLRTDDQAMKEMALLLANFLIESRNYVNSHIDDFTWTGYHVFGYKDGKRENWGYFCVTETNAWAKKNLLLEKYEKVSIRDNETRKETVYF